MTSDAQSMTQFGSSLGSSSAQQTFAAVAYLNMLPFFADDPFTKLYPSPRALNSNQPDCHAYCSSLIAGLASNIPPLTTQLGVFSSGAVLSVYLEPVLHSDSHAAFWKQLENLWAHQHPDPLTGIKTSDLHGRILLRSSGASEQSVWMIRVLCALAGFAVDVADAGPTHSDASPSVAGPKDKKAPEAQLWIGDPALENRLTNPNSYRIDVGQIWNSHLGRKAWFAGWFAGSQRENHQHENVISELMTRAALWNSRSEFSRWCAIQRFLQNQDSPLLNRSSVQNSDHNHVHDEQHWELRDTLKEYFSGLEFTLSADEGTQLLEFYLQINAALTQWQARSGTESTFESALHIPAGLLSGDGHGNICQSNSR